MVVIHVKIKNHDAAVTHVSEVLILLDEEITIVNGNIVYICDFIKNLTETRLYRTKRLLLKVQNEILCFNF